MWPFKKQQMTELGLRIVASINASEGWSANSHYLTHKGGLQFYVSGGRAGLGQSSNNMPPLPLNRADLDAIWRSFQWAAQRVAEDALKPAPSSPAQVASEGSREEPKAA